MGGARNRWNRWRKVELKRSLAGPNYSAVNGWMRVFTRVHSATHLNPSSGGPRFYPNHVLTWHVDSTSLNIDMDPKRPATRAASTQIQEK